MRRLWSLVFVASCPVTEPLHIVVPEEAEDVADYTGCQCSDTRPERLTPERIADTQEQLIRGREIACQ